jgi:hypothetical protein
MPKIYEYLGYIFFFYANEHLPIHVHISLGEFESKIELIYEGGSLKSLNVAGVKGKKPLSEKDIKIAKKFVKKYHEGIVKKWTNFFVLNQKVKSEIITEKI